MESIIEYKLLSCQVEKYTIKCNMLALSHIIYIYKPSKTMENTLSFVNLILSNF